jgi:predicted amidophosphoribosyltransferase
VDFCFYGKEILTSNHQDNNLTLMKETKCKDCGEEINTITNICPNCEKKQTNGPAI